MKHLIGPEGDFVQTPDEIPDAIETAPGRILTLRGERGVINISALPCMREEYRRAVGDDEEWRAKDLVNFFEYRPHILAVQLRPPVPGYDLAELSIYFRSLHLMEEFLGFPSMQIRDQEAQAHGRIHKACYGGQLQTLAML